MESVVRELRFVLKDRLVLITLLIGGVLSAFTVVGGLKESTAEMALIDRVKTLVAQDREYALAKQSDPGGAAYYSFHFTYDPPSTLAFVSRGIRDDLPWKHRIRMLALEGQIYETDVGNAELSRIGKLDFAFLAAFLLPLLSILLLYDLRASEVRENRWALLTVTSGGGTRLLHQRAALRSLLLYISVIIPFVVGAVSNGVSLEKTLLVLGAVAFNIVFWLYLTLLVVSRIKHGPTTAALLLGLWFTLAVAIPIGGKFVVEKLIHVPKGGEILLMQREAVNDAWDLPKEVTMASFIERHPEWAEAADVNRPFEWKWYYAFQQVGDQSVEPLSKSLRAGTARRDQAMGIVSFASPPLLTARLLSQAANTDRDSFQRYDNCVRDFHASLREFYYPMLFGKSAYSPELMRELPRFKPCLVEG